jgi:hypothetical protein
MGAEDPFRIGSIEEVAGVPWTIIAAFRAGGLHGKVKGNEKRLRRFTEPRSRKIYRCSNGRGNVILLVRNIQ